jgi:hypothetical protein
LESLARQPPTLSASILAVAIVVVAWAALWTVLRSVQWLRSRGKGAKSFKVVLEGGKDRIARITKDADLPQQVRDAKTVVIVAIKDGQRRSTTARLERRRQSKKFGDDSIALTQTVIDQLAIGSDADSDAEGEGDASSDQEVQLILRPLPWYSLRGLLDRTIFDTDQNTSLTWRIFLLSLLASVIVAHVYYVLEGIDQAQHEVPR